MPFASVIGILQEKNKFSRKLGSYLSLFSDGSGNSAAIVLFVKTSIFVGE
jgi:hypothetical protein